MPKKKKTPKKLSAADRQKILAEAKAKGLTADQVAKKYGVSKWTYYGWRNKAGGTTTRKVGPKGKAKTTAIDPNMLRSEIRAVLPGILREELAKALGVMAKRGR